MDAGQVIAERYELRSAIDFDIGQSWLAHDRTLGREVALEVVEIPAVDDGEAVERFRRDAAAAASLSHPHVVRVHDAGVADGLAYLSTEVLPGPTVGKLIAIEDRRMPVDRAVDLARQAAEGLAALHRSGVIHRDVIPRHLILDDQGRVRVVGFAIMGIVGATALEATDARPLMARAAWMSPEQAGGEAATDASDHYALGCVLMAMLTGAPPFVARARGPRDDGYFDPREVLQQHAEDAPPRVRGRRQEVPKELDGLVHGLLAKEPALRSSAFEALLALPPR